MANFKPKQPEKFSLSNIRKVCRICLFPNTILYSIFQNEIDKLISTFTPVKVEKNDGYPHQICPKCYKDVKTAYCFKKQCEYAHFYVKSMLTAPKKIITCNLCSTKFCSNSNLKRHLRNLHNLSWEIGSSRPDVKQYRNSTVIKKIKIEYDSDSLDQNLENDKDPIENFAEENDILIGDPEDAMSINNSEIKKDNYLEYDSNLSSSENCTERNSNSPTDKIIDNSIQFTKPLTIKSLIISESNINEDKIVMFDYFNLMPTEQHKKYNNLKEQMIARRKVAFKILKQVTKNMAKNKSNNKLNATFKNDNFECNECKQMFNRVDVLRRHQITHSNNPKIYSCGICNKLFSHPDYLKFHIKTFHLNVNSNRPYQCYICLILFAQASDLIRHVNFCGTEKGLYANQPFYKNIHGKENLQKQTVAAQIDNILINNDKIKSENIEEHSSKNNLTLLDFNIKKSSMYDEDNTSNSTTNINDSKQNLLYILSGYPGKHSEMMTRKLEAMKRNHHGKYECEICDKEFIRKTHLRRHYLTHTKIKSFQCVYCGSMFACPEYVQTHISRVHHIKSKINYANSKLVSRNSKLGKVDYKGEISEDPIRISNSSNNLNIKHNISTKYEIIKTQDGKFKCRFCDKMYNRTEHVRRHELIHSDSPKPFKCKYCSKEFTRSDYLKKHNKTCTFKPYEEYECKFCSNVCSGHEELKKHEFTHLNQQKQFKCKYCSKTFLKSNYLKKHIKQSCAVKRNAKVTEQA